MQSQQGVKPAAGGLAGGPKVGSALWPLLALLLACFVTLIPTASQAQTPTSTPEVFATAIATLAPEDLSPSADHVFYGEAVRLSATLNGTPVPPGTAFPTAEPPLPLSLRYSEPLPPDIPSSARLRVYHFGGTSWAPVLATRTLDSSGGALNFEVTRTGDYAVGAPALRIVVQPTAVSLRLGETVQFAATVLDEQDQVVPDLVVTWQATSAAGSITSDGLFTASGAPGKYQGAVVASLGSAEGYADVTISPWTSYLPLAFRGWEMQIRPNDPFFALQWNLLRIRAPQAWASSTGGPVVVAVIDTGVDLDHPDLQASLVPGLDFVDKLPGGSPSAYPDDENGHGTHVAGIVAALGNNGVGVSGVAWTARIMPMRVLDERGNGYVSDAVQAIKWAVDRGARILNLSLGTPETNSLGVFEDAIRYAQARNVLVVAASGNLPPFTLGQPVYPANFPGVLGVGSTGQGDAVSTFSNQGPWVDVTAPGEGIFSTYPLVSYPPSSGYQTMNGTSMATPHVSGLAALLWARYPQLSSLQVAAIIRNSAKDLGPAGYDQGFGWGRIDAGAALALAQSPVAIAAEEPLQAADQEASTVTETTLAAATPGDYRPGFLLVRAAPEAFAHARAGALPSLSALSSEELLPGWSLVRVPEGQEAEIGAQLADLPGVTGVFYDARIQAMD